MRRVNRHNRLVDNFGDDAVGNIEGAWLLSIPTDPFDLKGRADELPIAQDNFGDAVPNGGDLDRGRQSCGCRPKSEGEGLGIAECHILPPELLPPARTKLPGFVLDPAE